MTRAWLLLFTNNVKNFLKGLNISENGGSIIGSFAFEAKKRVKLFTFRSENVYYTESESRISESVAGRTQGRGLCA